MRKIIMLFVLIMIGLNSCSNDKTTNIEIKTLPWLHTKDFDNMLNLHATPEQTVILGLDDNLSQNKSFSGIKTGHFIRYYIANDEYYRFRLDTNDSCIEYVVVYDENGNKIFTLNQDISLSNIFLKSGKYQFYVKEKEPLPVYCSSAFMYNASNSTKNTPPKNSQPELHPSIWRAYSTTVFTGQGGFLTFLMGSDTFRYNYDISITPVAALVGYDYKNTSFSYNDNRILFNLTKDPYNYFILSVRDPSGKVVPLNTYLVDSRKQCNLNYSYLCFMDPFGKPLRSITAFGDPVDAIDPQHIAYYLRAFSEIFNILLCKNPYDCYVIYKLEDVTSAWLYSLTKPFHMMSPNIKVVFATGYTPGQPYYEQIRFSELYRYYPDASVLNGSGIRPKDIPDGEVAVYSGKNYSGQALVFNTNTNLDISFIDFSSFPVNSIRFAKDTSTLVLSDGTFLGTDLADTSELKIVLKNPKVFKAIEIVFSQDCPRCNLQEADLSNHKFDGRNFRGANFRRAKLYKSSFVKTDFREAFLQGAILQNSNLQSANLCKAMLNKDPDYEDTTILEGAYLQNANLAFVEATGATFVNANFHTPLATQSCIPDEMCNVKACATAYKATMPNTNFSGAYLGGVDFSGSVLTAAKFVNAFLVGANFSYALLNNDPVSGQSGAIFSGSLLHGSNFNNANTKGVIFLNSYFDDQITPPQVGATATIYLDTNHTNFPGSKFLNSYVCPKFSAPRVTTSKYLPQTDKTVLCPNGEYGPCVDAKWKPLSFLDNSRITVGYGSSFTQIPTMCDPSHVYLFW